MRILNRKFSVIFVATSSSSLAVARYNMIKQEVKEYRVLFFDLADCKLKEKVDAHCDTEVSQGHILILHLKRFYSLAKTIIFLRPAVIHFHNASNQLVNFCSLLTFRKVICTPQGSDINQKFKGLNKFTTKILLWRSNYITAKSEAMSRRVKEISGREPILLHWGVERTFTNSPCKITDSKSITIMSSRAYEANYNVDLIIEAIRVLKDSGLPIKFIVASRTDSVHLHNNSVIDELHIGVSADVMKKLYDRSDAVVSIPEHDGFSTSNIEALCRGTFLIISDLPTYKGEIFRERNCIKVCSNDLNNLSEYIKLVGERIDDIRKHRIARGTKARQLYSLDSQSSIVRKIYTEA